MRPVPRQLADRLYAAAVPIANHGLDHTKIEDIAAATGVPKATLYYYFAGKEEILAFLLSEMLTRMRDAVAAAVNTAASARNRLRAVVRAQLSMIFEHPAICQALLGDLGRAGRIPELAEGIRAAFRAPVERLIADGADDGTLRAVADPSTTATALFGAVTVTGLSHLVDQEGVTAERAAEAVLDIVLSGLAVPEAE